MTAKDMLTGLVGMNDFLVNEYLKDLSDDEILMRPAPGANHIAWQLGHLIHSEVQLLSGLPGATKFSLPPNFATQHSKDTAAIDPPTGFLTKTEYLKLYAEVRAHTKKFVDSFPESEYDGPTHGPLASIAPTHGTMLVLIGNHPMLHVGQFVVLRRKLGKAIII